MKLIKRLISYYKTLLWVAVMCYLLFSPGNSLPKTSLFEIPHFDKVVHFLMFSGFAFFWLIDSKESSKFFIILILCISIAFAALSEIIQLYFIPGRSGNIYDFLSDLSGLLTGLFLYFFIWKKFLLIKFKRIR